MAAPLGDLPEEVQEIMPAGQVVTLPETWRLQLASIKERNESPSSIVTFMSCPLRWYIERYGPIPMSDEPSYAAMVGTIVHRVLEIFYTEPADLRTESLLNDTFKKLWRSLNADSEEIAGDPMLDWMIKPDMREQYNVLLAGANNPDGMRGGMYKKAKESVDNVLAFDDDPRKIQVVSNESWVSMRVNGTRVRGKIDRIVRAPKGQEDIHDWKTGRPCEGEPTVFDTAFLPVGLYALMRTKMTERDIAPAHVRAARLLYLSHLKRATIKIDDDTLNDVQNIADGVTRMMEDVVVTGDIIATPGDTASDGPCRWCPISQWCPVWTDETFDGLIDEFDLEG